MIESESVPISKSGIPEGKFALKLVLPTQDIDKFRTDIEKVLKECFGDNLFKSVSQNDEDGKILSLIFEKSGNWAKASIKLMKALGDKFKLAKGEQTFFEFNGQGLFEFPLRPLGNSRYKPLSDPSLVDLIKACTDSTRIYYDEIKTKNETF